MKYCYFLLVCWVPFCFTMKIKLSNQEIEKLGERIYTYECASRPENLTYWKEKERHASLGIGHFIWLPEKQCRNPQFNQ